ncbi:hypothetical protein [Streptomyces sp. HUAS TT7]|uniref:hypothetical protein n=1 Tax=Streptomyces sp. HUAS TT7 TaxID=3447507 RepID=UPI003F656C63
MSLADGSSRSIGFWPEELVEPVRVFGQAGADVTLATPGGKPAVADSAGFTPEGQVFLLPVATNRVVPSAPSKVSWMLPKELALCAF